MSLPWETDIGPETKLLETLVGQLDNRAANPTFLGVVDMFLPRAWEFQREAGGWGRLGLA
jgi:hypothetical protein